MDRDRRALVEHVLDHYEVLLHAVAGRTGEAINPLPRLLDRLTTAELRALSASFALLAAAAERLGGELPPIP